VLVNGRLCEVLRDVSDGVGQTYTAIELRLLLTNYSTEILSFWTKEFDCYITALVLLYVMQDLYEQANKSGSVQPSVGYTVRALEVKSGISKSTIHRKLKYLEKLGILNLYEGKISIAYDEDGASTLQRKMPRGKTITDQHIRKMLATCRVQQNENT
jgi:DNA-binding transcriptional regulator YhcF (GntR family)